MFFEDKRIIGLDIGDSSIKLVELERVKGIVKAVDYALIDTGWKSASIESDSAKEKALYGKIRELVSRMSFENVSCVVGISGQAVFLRFVKLPAVEKKKMDQIVKYEAQQQVPFPIEEVRWDYQLLGKFRKEERDILLVAIKQDIVRNLVGAVCETGLMPEIIDVLPLSLYNCIAHNGLLSDEAALIIDSGAKTTNLVVAEGGELWIRSIPIAGNTITQCVAEDLKTGFEEAERLKIASGISVSDNKNNEKLRLAIDRGVSRLFAEISRSLGFYKSQYSGSPIKKIFITGGGSMLNNMDAALSERFKIPVERIDPFNKLAVGIEDPARREELQKSGHLLANAVGLALREVSRTPLKINLIPPDIIRQRKIVKKFAYFAASFLAVLTILFSVNVYSLKTARANDTRCGDLSAYINHIEILNRHFKKINDELAVINNKLNIISQLIDSRGLWMKTFIEIQKVMAPNIWIENIASNLEEAKTPSGPPQKYPSPVMKAKQSAKAQEGKEPQEGSVIYIEGKGIGTIEKDIPQFKDALEKSSFFKDVQIVSAEIDGGLIRFVIRLRLEKAFLK